MLKTIKCPHCGAALKIKGKQENVKCEYCDSEFVITDDNSDSKNEEAKKGIKERVFTVRAIPRFIFGALIFFLALAFFIENRPVAGVFCLLSSVVLLPFFHVLVSRKMQEKGKQTIRILSIPLAVILFFVSLIILGNTSAPRKRTVTGWPKTEIASQVEHPDHPVSVSYSSNDYLSIYILHMTESEYDEYVKSIKEDFNRETEYTETSHKGYNAEGYQIHVWYDRYDSETSVTLNAPIDVSEGLVWPSDGPGAALPDPGSTVGKITINTPQNFAVNIGEIDRKAFDSYVERCIALGFDKKQRRYSDVYYAENADGDRLNLCYEGLNIMTLSLDCKD